MVQTHVTWGKNTVFNTPAAGVPAAPTPGVATPATPRASNFLFAPAAASSTIPAFSTTPTPSPGGSFSFSSAPVTTPQTPAAIPAPSIGLFGISTPTPAATPAATSFFSPNTASTSNVNINTTTANMLGAPQQAALQAHMNATLHQESSRFEAKLLQLHAAYCPYQQPAVPTPAPSAFMAPTPLPAQNYTPSPTCRFQHIFYDAMTPTQRTEQLSLGIANYPQKPNHIPIELWNHALSRNPNVNEYIPVLITSAEGLHSRLVSQQSKMKLLNQYLESLLDTIQKRIDGNYQIEYKLKEYQVKNVQLKRKLLGIMKKVDFCRGKNVPLQQAECQLIGKLRNVMNSIQDLDKMLEHCKSDGENFQRQLVVLEHRRRDIGAMGGAGLDGNDGLLDGGFKHEVHALLNQCGNGIDELRKTVKKDERDLGIMKNGLTTRNI